MTSFLNLQTEVQAAGPFDTTTASAGRIALWVNQAQHWVLTKRRWSFLETKTAFATANGQATYVILGTSPVVPDVDQIISLLHNDSASGTKFGKLTYFDQQAFDELTSFGAGNTGIPVIYTIRGNTPQTTSGTILSGGNQVVQLWPIPSFIGSAQVSYFRTVASVEMTANADVPIVPVPYHQAIIHRAVGIGLALKGALAQAQAANQYAEELLQQAMATDTVARRGDLAPEQQPVVPSAIPPSPAAGANPANSPYSWRAA